MKGSTYGAFIYVADTGSNSVAVVDTQRNVTIELIPVGRAPIGVALVEVPAASCPPADVDGFGTVTVDEILLAVRHALDGCP